MKILVVEDEAGMREALIRALANEGYSADGAADGEEGFDFAETGVYDLVLLDIMLPKRSGLDVLRTLRDDGVTVPVIMITAKSALDDKVAGMDLGADDYLTKPFEMEELFARIRMVSRRALNVSVGNDIKAGDLTLNLHTYELSLCKPDASKPSCAGTEMADGCGFGEGPANSHSRRVKLGAKEFSLMEYLMLNSGIILSREQITDKIWGYDSDAEYNNVDVYVSFLRKKMQFIGTSVRIDSVRGVGYILRTEE